jgi:hypothetical protein
MRIILALLFTVNLQAQTYDLINDIINELEADSIYLKDNFTVLNKNDNDFIVTFLKKDFFINNWKSISDDKYPDIKPFLENFDISHLKAIALNEKGVEKVDFKKLSTKVISKSNFAQEERNYGNKKGILHMSKPIFNCSKDWAIVYRFSEFALDVGNSGDIYIYKKENGKWVYYHNITVWIS